ncbi:response regulator transcription factor [Maricurvus nonylphenolicus]|uniref:response regulator transcription factor n=1 Tax=Maricurvus nonylphenolicus TaxID=1008307 RepID=UPI0036F43992
MQANKILVVEDDQTVNGLICQNLETEGYTVTCVFDGENGVSQAVKENYDLILLDVMMPKLDGFEVLSRLREKKQTPVLMLTAKGGEQDRICGFQSGADDYLIKPFNMAELTLRIEAILRRTQTVSQPSVNVVRGAVVLDPLSGEVLIHSKPIAFTPLEFDLLRSLMEQAGKVVSKAELYQSVLCREYSRYDRTLDMHISKIRKKMSSAGLPINTIRTVRGQGYSFEG